MNGLEVSSTVMQELWKIADADGDGAISLSEFQAVWELTFVEAEIAQLEAEARAERKKAERAAAKEAAAAAAQGADGGAEVVVADASKANLRESRRAVKQAAQADEAVAASA